MQKASIIFLILIVLSIVHTRGQDIDYPIIDFITEKKVKVSSIITQIEKNTEYTFVYTNKLLKQDNIISLPRENLDLETFLKEVLNPIQIEFRILEKQIILSKRSKKVKKITISGVIRDSGTGETLVNANVYDIISEQGVTSNDHGFYSITYFADTVNLRFSYVGYKPKYFQFISDNSSSSFKELNIDLDQVILDELKINSNKKYEYLRNATPGEIDFTMQKIKMLPLVYGDADPLKALQLFPGVQSGRGDTGHLHVRGGGKDQNLMLVDGTMIYQPYHLFGVFSVFNSDAIKKVRLIKSGFPAMYGGRTSSVLDVILRDGNKKKFSGSLDINDSNFKGLIEGPIVKNKLSFLVSARRSFISIFNDFLYAVYDLQNTFVTSFLMYIVRLAMSLTLKHKLI